MKIINIEISDVDVKVLETEIKNIKIWILSALGGKISNIRGKLIKQLVPELSIEDKDNLILNATLKTAIEKEAERKI